MSSLIISYLASLLLGMLIWLLCKPSLPAYLLSSLPLLLHESKPIFYYLKLILLGLSRMEDRFDIMIEHRYLHDPIVWFASSVTALILLRIGISRTVLMVKDIGNAYVEPFERAERIMGVNAKLLVTSDGKPYARSLYTFFFRPVIVVSIGLLETLTDEELTAVFVHEMSHILNRHLLRRNLLVLFLPFYLLNPFSYAIFKDYASNMEIEADMKVKELNLGKELAHALTKITQFQS